jgi:hypothetical protein
MIAKLEEVYAEECSHTHKWHKVDCDLFLGGVMWCCADARMNGLQDNHVR